jgi:hypothetical protein
MMTMVMAMWLGVRIYDSTGVPAKDLAAARSTVQQTLRRASIDLVWQDCSRINVTRVPLCDEPLRNDDVMIRIVASPSADFAPAMLGYSLVDAGAHTGTLATIFADRVASMARRAVVSDGRLLGLAMAHEIGHMLLGTSAHASCGLMRARWFDDELRRDAARDWAWSREEQAAMRRGLAARSHERDAPGPVLVVRNER